MRFRGATAGVTLVELLIVMAIAAILTGVVATALSLFLRVPAVASNKMTALHDLEMATHWVVRDARAAETFYPLSSPHYGYFRWRDYTQGPPVTYVVTYTHSAGALVRRVARDGTIESREEVAHNIANQSDATFTWSPASYSLSVVITSTVGGPGTIAPAVITTAVTAALRPRSEYVAPPPSLTPVPTPPPGAVVYYVVTGPRVVTGTYVSGNAASLHDADTNYYVVGGVSIGGAWREIAWDAGSEEIPSPPTVGSLSVILAGRTSHPSTLVSFYVENETGGFPEGPNYATTYDQADTDYTAVIPIQDPATISHINSTRRVTVRVQARRGGTLTFSTNQVNFTVGP